MTFIVPDDGTPVVRFMPVCEHCGGPVREQRCDPIDITEPWDRMRTQVPGPTYNLPCGCIIRPGRERQTLDRAPSGEHTSADTDDVVASINAAMEDWETDAARWSPDGSHEHDPPYWTRMDYGNGAGSGQADWGCDDVAERMENPDAPLPAFTWDFADENPDAYPTARLRPGSTACFPWQGAQPPRGQITITDETHTWNTERMQEAARGFTDAIHQIQMSLYRSAARFTRQWSEIFADLAERNEPVRVQLHTGRRSGRTEAIRRLQREIEQGRIRLETPLPHADLEPLELPTITPGDEVRVNWPGGGSVQFTIDEHERRTRASWEGLT